MLAAEFSGTRAYSLGTVMLRTPVVNLTLNHCLTFAYFVRSSLTVIRQETHEQVETLNSFSVQTAFFSLILSVWTQSHCHADFCSDVTGPDNVAAAGHFLPSENVETFRLLKRL